MPRRGSGKLPGKTEFSGRRRAITRKSGFHSHADSTGGELRFEDVKGDLLEAGESLTVAFCIPPAKTGQFVGFGGWYKAPRTVVCALDDKNVPGRYTLTPPAAPNWSKFGSMWMSETGENQVSAVRFTIIARSRSSVHFWGLGCGIIQHDHLASARQVLLKNMYQFSPEAHFYVKQGKIESRLRRRQKRVSEARPAAIALKSCNRCARFLPVNLSGERNHLSFSNHCVAEHRRPCSHSGFGKLRNLDTGQVHQLEYGFQLECRFCKKFEVNAAHNPMRTAAQMKEDAQRRRAFELLTTELFRVNPLLRYRHLTGRELTDDVWEKFEGKCFNCNQRLTSRRKMHLDHTRPLALLWPLDGTATALCKSCNSQKRDRAPVEFYLTHQQLVRLSQVTGVPLTELRDPSPNVKAVQMLSERLDWFFDEFLCKAELTKVREGKTAAELLVKALQKVINKCPPQYRFHLKSEFERRRA